MNERAKYLGEGSFSQEVIVWIRDLHAWKFSRVFDAVSRGKFRG